MNRRAFLSAGLVGLSSKAERPIAGGFVFEDEKTGHRLRDGSPPWPRPARRQRVPLVIVGGGIAGLSAAWELNRRGFRDFVLLEMNPQAGGNSRWGENEISRYPWAAHYLPVPDSRATLVRELCEELGLLKDGRWEERDLCFSPQERLFQYGHWYEGLEPTASKADRDQYRRFEECMARFRASGEFTIPMARGAKPSVLDQIPMAEWLRRNRFDAPGLEWYVNYACRDDYGALASATSAWAGIHYFASRAPEEKGPLTWPEGNGWILERLLERLGAFVRTRSIVYRIRRDGVRLRIVTPEVEYLAEGVIYAAPTFTAPYVIEDAPRVAAFEYSPWLTANLVLDRWPAERGFEPAWDNVIFRSPGLGYVVANHQSLATHFDGWVWTYYMALAAGRPLENRRRLLGHDWAYWRDVILDDLAAAHPNIRDCVRRVDIFRIGHAMIRPAVGFIWSAERQAVAERSGNLVFANSDLSGLSIFEEAQYRGVLAARRMLRRFSRG